MSEFLDEFPEDCARLQDIAKSHGHELTLEQCEEAWSAMSLDWCANWLTLPKDDEQVWQELFPYIDRPK